MKNLTENLILTLACAAVASPFAFKAFDEPDGWIPMWLGPKSQVQTCLINTDNIVMIQPVYDEDSFTSRKPVINYIDVYMSDGRKLTVTEDFEEFKKRIRNSR